MYILFYIIINKQEKTNGSRCDITCPKIPALAVALSKNNMADITLRLI